MSKEQHIRALERLLKGAPEIMSPRQASKWSPLGKNLVYELIHKGELQSFRYRGTFLIAKSDLIDYLSTHADDKPVHPTGTGKKEK